MKTELKYIVFWFTLLFCTTIYMVLLLLKFSYPSLHHIIQTCVTGLSSAIHLGNEALPVIVFPLVIMGLLSIFLKICLSLVKTKRRVAQISNRRTYGMSRKLRRILSRSHIDANQVLVVKSSQPYAYTIGFFSSVIVLSSNLIRSLSSAELEAVVVHERHHQRHAHALLFFLAEITRSILFMIPVLKEIYIEMKLKLEVDADQSVLLHQKTNAHLLAALQKVIYQPVIGYYPGIATYGLTDRIQVLHHSSSTSHSLSRRSIIVSVCMVFAGGMLLMFPRTPEAYATSIAEIQSCALRTKSFSQNMSSFTQRFSPVNY